MEIQVINAEYVCALCKQPLQFEAAPSGHEDHRHISCPRCNPGFLMCLKIKVSKRDEG